MGVPKLLNWIKKKYPRAIRKTLPTFESYDMLFVDMPQYVQSTFQLTKKPYSNSCILISKILSNIDRVVQFAQPNEVIFFSFECINGFIPYAIAITKRFRKMQIKVSDEDVFTEEEENIELLKYDELNVEDDNELAEALKELSKLDSEKNIEKMEELIDKINQNKINNAKKVKKVKTMSNKELEEIELDENEIPTLLTIDELMKTIKKADYDKERTPNNNDFQIEFRKEFENFIMKKMKIDPLY